MAIFMRECLTFHLMNCFFRLQLMKQLGDDIGAVVGLLLERNNIPKRQKPIGAIRGASVTSIYLRTLLNYNLPFNILPTVVGSPAQI